MTNRIWKNAKKMFVVEAVILLSFSLVLFLLLAFTLTSQYLGEVNKSIEKFKTNIDKSDEEVDKSYESFENVNSSKVRLAAYYIKRGSEDPARWTLNHIAEILNVKDIILVNKDGEVLQSASGQADQDFNDPIYRDIMDVFSSREETAVVYDDRRDEKLEGNFFIYFAGQIDSSTLVVMEIDSSGIQRDINNEASWDELVERSILNNNGIVILTDVNGEIIFSSYKGDEKKENISDFGLDLAEMRQGTGRVLKFNGSSYFVKAEWMEKYNSFVVIALQVDNMITTILVTMVVTIFILFVCMSLQVLYSLIVLRDEASKKKNRRSMISVLFRSTAGFAAICLAIIIGSSFYIQMIYTLSLQSITNNQDVEALGKKLDKNDVEKEYKLEGYKNDVIARARLAASFISNNRDIITTGTMVQLADILGVEHVLVYNKEGVVIASDSTYHGLTPSKNEEDMSYEFRKLIYGIPYVYQDKPDPGYLDEEYQYAGVVIPDEEGNANGFVQLALDPELLDDYMQANTFKSILDNYSGSNGSFTFAINKESGQFTYFPSTRYIGRLAEDCGINIDNMYDGFTGYINIDKGKYYVSCLSGEETWLFVATNMNSISSQSIGRALNISIAGSIAFFLMLAVILLVGTSGFEHENTESDREKKKTAYNLIMNRMGDIPADERMRTYIKFLCMFFAGIITIVIALRNVFFRSESVFNYIMDMKWDKGLHIFSVTACLLTSVWVIFVAVIASRVLLTMGRVLGANGITVCRMLSNFVKYIAVIGLLYFCLNMLGAKPNALLVSAGVLSMIVALGAQSLVSDVIAGFFIVFEGEFKVGDIIRIDDYRGEVTEIGIRTTKVRDIDSNYVKVIQNSKLNNVLNLSNGYIFTYLRVSIDYDVDLERIENIINEEMPVLRKNLTSKAKDPKFLGMDSFADSSLVLLFKVSCKEEDILMVRRNMNRQIRLMFARNDIEIPFNQIVVSQRAPME